MPFQRLGPRQYGDLNPQAFATYGMGGGLNVKAAPQEVDDDDLTDAANVYLDFDGGVEMRKGITTHASQISTSAGSNLVRFYQMVKAGAVQNPALVVTIAQIGGNLYNADTGAAIGAANVVGSTAQPFSTARVFDPQHAGGASDVLVMATGSGGPYLYDGTAVSTPASWTTYAASARWTAVVNNVLWFGGIPAQPNLVVGTQIGNPETENVYAQFACSRPVTGLGVVGAGAQAQLVVGHAQGLTVISGVGPGNFVVQEVASTDGVAAGRTMINVDGYLYYLGAQSFYMFDGATITVLSDKVEPWITSDPTSTYPIAASNRSAAWAFFYDHKIFVAYDAGPGYPNFFLVYDTRVRGWTYITGISAAGACLLDAPQDAKPFAALIIDSTKGQVYNWDVYTGSGFNNHGVSDNGVVIAARAQTKFFKVGLPGARKTMKRAYPELFIEQFGGQFAVATDYGGNSVQTVIQQTGAAQAQWDVAQWDTATFPSGPIQFIHPRLDFSIKGEAFAFAVSSNDTNPPWKWSGTTGTFVQEARN